MRELGIALVLATISGAMIGCGGADIPEHSGYKNDRVKPWKKPKLIPLDDKNEGKAEGELVYAEYTRARWYAVDLPEEGELDVKIETATVNEGDEEFDVAFEVLDQNFQVLIRADNEEEDAHELNKTRTLYELTAGRYLIHLYLQRRIDQAEYDLKVAFRPQSKAFESDFPAQVAFVGRLPGVPPFDDTPAGYRPQIVRKPTSKKPGSKKPVVEKAPVTNTMSASIINVVVSGAGSIITVNRGTNQGISDGMTGYVKGLKGASFKLSSCGERSCKATVAATPDQISRAGSVFIVQ
jgi:hypothetical protein